MLDRVSGEDGGAAQPGALHTDEVQERLQMSVAHASYDDPRANAPLHDRVVIRKYTTRALHAGPRAHAASEVGSFVAPSGGRHRKHIIRVITSVLTTVDNEGTLIWNVGPSRTPNFNHALRGGRHHP